MDSRGLLILLPELPSELLTEVLGELATLPIAMAVTDRVGRRDSTTQ